MVALDARQLMGPAEQSLLASDSVLTAARRMRSLGVSSIPICGAGNEFLGIVSERDIVQRCVAEAIDPGEMAVGRLVTLPQESIDADRPADSAVLRLILDQQLGLLPVLDHGVLVGVITLAGMAAHLVDDDDIDDRMGEQWPTSEPWG